MTSPTHTLAATSDVAPCIGLSFQPPSREGGECVPAPISAFLATFIAAPSRVYVNPPRPDFGPQYDGRGECPF